MDTPEPIAPELRARIDSLPEGRLKARIVRALTGPGKREATNEEIFDHIVKTYTEAVAQNEMREARLYKWRDDDVASFIEFFQEKYPQWYADYLHQERNGREISPDLAWNMRILSEEWLPGLGRDDYDELFGKVRDYADAHLI